MKPALQAFDAFLDTLFSEHKPASVIQVGMEDENFSRLLIDRIVADEEATCTIVAPARPLRLTNEKGDLQVRRDEVSNRSLPGVERLRTPIEETLPDLAFQSQQFDFAVMNMSDKVDDVIVAFYYLKKMLAKGGFVCFVDGYRSAYRPLRDLIAADQEYQLFNVGDEIPLQEQTWVQKGYAMLPDVIRNQAESVLNPELLSSLKSNDSNSGIWVLERQAGEASNKNMDFDTLLASIMEE